MTTKITSRYRKFIARSLFLATVVVVPIITASTPAFAVASPDTCMPTDVAYFIGSTYAYMSLVCNDSGGPNGFVAWNVGAAGCASNLSIDVLKIWMSQAQSALLSGKHVKISSFACGGYNVVSGLELLSS